MLQLHVSVGPVDPSRHSSEKVGWPAIGLGWRRSHIFVSFRLSENAVAPTISSGALHKVRKHEAIHHALQYLALGGLGQIAFWRESRKDWGIWPIYIGRNRRQGVKVGRGLKVTRLKMKVMRQLKVRRGSKSFIENTYCASQVSVTAHRVGNPLYIL